VSELQVAFMVEPFVDGHPGPHVRAALDAVEAAGLTVTMGPFDNSASGSADQIADAVARAIRAAFANGATRLSIQVISE
jgi:uncharacterized protein YqgV (UPF0045/DUF77 family)